MLPTIDKPGYCGFYLTGEDLDLAGLVSDEDALRRTCRERVDREDLVFGRIEVVSLYRHV